MRPGIPPISRVLVACLRSTRAVSAVEFALLAPIFIGCVLLVIEGGRMEWTQQALNEVAANTARCMAVGSTACADTPSITSYARARGTSFGVGLANATIVTASNQTCSAVTGMNKVTITLPFKSATGNILPSSLTLLTATACYPSIS